MTMLDFDQGQQQQPFPQVKKAQVVELSKALSIAQQRAEMIGMKNSPADPVGRVETQAEYRMAADAYAYARERYDRAFDAWARGGYQE